MEIARRGVDEERVVTDVADAAELTGLTLDARVIDDGRISATGDVHLGGLNSTQWGAVIPMDTVGQCHGDARVDINTSAVIAGVVAADRAVGQCDDAEVAMYCAPVIGRVADEDAVHECGVGRLAYAIRRPGWPLRCLRKSSRPEWRLRRQ